jgi:Fe-S cluster biosynthesis and repair protein YggX
MGAEIGGSFTCVRCRRDDVAALDAAPVPGALGAEVQQKICSACWTEWQGMEVMVINELRLNFMDPKSQAILDQHLREFLCLDPESTPPAGPPDS